MSKGLRITRRFTEAGKDPFDKLEWSRRDSRITNPDGSVVFEMKDAEIPAGWSQVAADIMVSKYFRKAGVPQFDDDGDPSSTRAASRCSARSGRPSRSSAAWPAPGGIGARSTATSPRADDASAFEDELKYMLVNQMAAPNSPQWFNTGLNWAYGITGPAQGFCYVDPADGEVKASPDAYTRPAPHACFIQSVRDDLVNPGGIMDLWVREARLFKYGSGTGTNFSQIRGEGEPLSGGGKSSGLMSFLKVGDRAAGAIKSGGTTRRAAKMVILDVDHPDIETFINWKKVEEDKARALIDHGGLPRRLQRRGLRHGLRPELEQLGPRHQRVHRGGDRRRRLGPDRRTDGSVRKTVKARDLWRPDRRGGLEVRRPRRPVRHHHQRVAHLPAGGRISAANPCSEYMFLDNTACNLASLNLVKFVDAETGDVRRRGLPPRGPALDHRARDLGAHGAVPLRGDRPGLLRLPHPRPRLRQPRHRS